MRYLLVFTTLLLTQLLANTAPVVTSSAITSINKDATYTYAPQASDADNDPLTWSALSLPSWLGMNGEWSSLGSAGFSLGGANYANLVMDANDTPYIVYSDKDNSDAISVMRYREDNASWEVVGSSEFSAGAAYYTSIALNSEGTPYVAFADADSGEFATVMRYNDTNNTWEIVGSAGFSSGISDYLRIAIDNNDTPYVIYADQDHNDVPMVMKYLDTNDSWITLGSISTGGAGFTDIAFDSNNTLYIVYADGDNNDKASVMQYHDTNDTWSVIGSGNFSNGSASYLHLAFDTNDTPYVIYSDKSRSYKAVVQRYNGADWENLGADGFSEGAAYSTQIAIDTAGTVYAVFEEYISSSRANVMAYRDGSWQELNASTLSSSTVHYTDMALNSKQEPYVLYQDLANSYKATLMRYTQVVLSGTPGEADIGVHDVNLSLSDSHSSVAYNFQITVNDVNTPPTASDTNITIDEDSTYVFSLNDFNFSDADTGDSLQAIYLTSLPAKGTLLHSGVSAVIDEAISDPSNLSYTPPENAYGEAYDSFGFVVNDGEDNSSESYTLGISITAVNDAPEVTSSAVVSVTELSEYSYELQADDIEGDSLTWSVTDGTSLPSWLTLTAQSGWQSVGDTGFSEAAVYGNDIAIDSEGTPYVLYENQSDPATLVVMTYHESNASWEPLGGTILEGGSLYDAAFMLDSNDTPYVAYIDGNNNAQLSVYRYDGSNWVQLGAFNDIEVDEVKIAFDSHNTPYIIYADMISTVYVVKYIDGNDSWQSVGSTIFSEDAANPVLAFDSNDTLYVAHKNYNPQGGYLSTYHDANNSWSVVGATPFSVTSLSSLDLAFDSHDTPYVVYVDYNQGAKATVMHYSEGSWQVLGSSGFTTKTYSTQIAVSSDDTPYVMYTDADDDYKAYMMRFDGESWVEVGSDGVSEGSTNYANMALAPNDTPYVAYGDIAHESKATVMRYLTPELSGTPGYDDAGVYDINLTLSDGNTSVAYNFQITVANLNREPEITSTAVTTVAEGETYNYILEAEDPDGDTLSWSVSEGTSLPSWLSLSPQDGWQSVGSLGDESAYGDYLVLDSNATPYIAYSDDYGVCSVMRYNESSGAWEAVGADSLNLTEHNIYALAIDAHDDLYIAYAVYDTSEANISVKKYASGSWSTLGNTDFATDIIEVSMVFDSSNTPYVLTLDPSSTPSIYKYSDANASWQSINASALSTIMPSAAIDFDSSDNLYLAYYDGNEDNASLAIYHDANASWSIVGDESFASGYNSYLSLFIDADDTPYIAYSDFNEGRKATLKRYSEGSWQTLGSAGFSEGKIYCMKLALTPDGTPYVLYSDMSRSQQAVVMRYENSQWVEVGDGASDANVYITSIGFDNDAMPYVAYMDMDNNYTAKVMRYVKSKLYGTAGNSDAGTYEISLDVSDGSDTLTYTFEITVTFEPDAPYDITLIGDSILENNAMNDLIGALSASDYDAGDTFTFSLTCNATNFGIDESGLRIKVVADYETQSSYEVCIRVTDSYGLSYDENFTISINDDVDTDEDGVEDSLDEDDDGDGMSDAFENQYGLNQFDPTDADEDMDSDGFTNLQEYKAGTEPDNDESIPTKGINSAIIMYLLG